jgi:dTDP-4-amino-4,6-dideoxygalactose transaminase
VKILRAHGASPKYYHKLLGGNFRLDAVQAAIVAAKLPHLDGWTAARQRNAKQYDRLFTEAGLATGGSHEQRVGLPRVVTDRHIFNQYVIRVSERDRLKAALQARGVGTEVYYPVPMHLQECFEYLGHLSGSFPESERAANETLAIPVHPELSDAQAQYVVDCIHEVIGTASEAVA